MTQTLLVTVTSTNLDINDNFVCDTYRVIYTGHASIQTAIGQACETYLANPAAWIPFHQEYYRPGQPLRFGELFGAIPEEHLTKFGLTVEGWEPDLDFDADAWVYPTGHPKAEWSVEDG